MAVQIGELDRVVKGIFRILNPLPLEPGRNYGGGAQQLENLLGYNSTHSLLKSSNGDPIVKSE